MQFVRKCGGYSLIEVVIVLAIIALLSGMVLTYTQTSRAQLALFTDEQKVVGLLNRAKTFTLEKRLQGTSANACAFGAHFEKPRTVIFFQDLSSSDPPCVSGSYDFLYDGAAEKLDEVDLSPSVEIASFAGTDSPTRDVVFEAPYLATYSNWPGALAPVNAETIMLRISGTDSTVSVNVNPGGAITAQ